MTGHPATLCGVGHRLSCGLSVTGSASPTPRATSHLLPFPSTHRPRPWPEKPSSGTTRITSLPWSTTVRGSLPLTKWSPPSPLRSDPQPLPAERLLRPAQLKPVPPGEEECGRRLHRAHLYLTLFCIISFLFLQKKKKKQELNHFLAIKKKKAKHN